MTRMLAALIVLAFLSPVLADDEVVGSGKITAETRELAEFDAIELRIAADMHVKIGKATPLKVEGDDNILPLIKTEVRDRRLVISSDSKFRSKHGVDLKVTVANLKAVEIQGAGDMHVHGLDNESFSVDVSGAADVHVDGTTEQLAVRICGAGDVLAFGLEAQAASVSITGAGDAKVSVANSLDAVIVGAGDVHYKGDPKVHKVITGSGDVKRVKSK
jgi:hypothetical protein